MGDMQGATCKGRGRHGGVMNNGRRSAGEFDGVVVVGAGAAGMAAAISVAQLGVKVALLEQGSDVGGIVAHGLIHTIGGLYDSKGQYINQGLPVELAKRLTAASSYTRPRKMGRVWVLNACPNTYLKVVRDWISAEPNLTPFLQTTDIHVKVQDRRVSSVEFSREGREFVLHPIALSIAPEKRVSSALWVVVMLSTMDMELWQV